jgi:hypothetical protein
MGCPARGGKTGHCRPSPKVLLCTESVGVVSEAPETAFPVGLCQAARNDCPARFLCSPTS